MYFIRLHRPHFNSYNTIQRTPSIIRSVQVFAAEVSTCSGNRSGDCLRLYVQDVFTCPESPLIEKKQNQLIDYLLFIIIRFCHLNLRNHFSAHYIYMDEIKAIPKKAYYALAACIEMILLFFYTITGFGKPSDSLTR